MRQVEYIDDKGRKYAVLLPPEITDADVHMGIFKGPPDVVDVLELPEPFATRLHNTLYDREIFSIRDIQKPGGDLRAVFMSALQVDVNRLAEAFLNFSKDEPE